MTMTLPPPTPVSLLRLSHESRTDGRAGLFCGLRALVGAGASSTVAARAAQSKGCSRLAWLAADSVRVLVRGDMMFPFSEWKNSDGDGVAVDDGGQNVFDGVGLTLCVVDTLPD